MSALECSWVIISAQECSLCHGTMLKGAYDRPWLPISTEECSLVLLRVHGAMIMNVDGCSGAFMSTNEHSSVLIGSHGQSNTLLSMVPWHSEHSWALVSTHEHSRSLLVPWQLSLCPKMLLSIHECSRLLLCAHDCSSAWLKVTRNVNCYNDHPVVICKYLSLDFTKW